MKTILSILKSRLFLSSVGVGLMLALVMMLGRWFDWSIRVQLFCVIGVLVVALSILLISFIRAQRNATEIQSQIQTQGVNQQASTRPEKREEIENLQKKLNSSIERLKKSKLGRGHRAPLYALPWYMMIGPPGMGKTVALSNSGLNFPLGTQRRHGVGGTRNCDWFFSDSAILLDTAGRYITEHDDAEEWFAFLDVLRKHRTSQPINGVIIGISVDKLAGSSSDDIEWHANKIRRRIDELIERLGVQFPVYLVFTKCDLLNGFTDFFGDLTPEEKHQVWGASFSEDRLSEEGNDAPKIFGEEFEKLHERLLDRRGERVSRISNPEVRRRVFLFPMEFEAIKSDVQEFVRWLFLPNPYQESPVWRGFYFTSGTQGDGQIMELVDEYSEENKALEKAPHAGNEVASDDKEDQRKASRSFFINDLFTDVIIPDQYLVKRTNEVARRKRYLLAGTTTAVIFALVLYAVGVSQALFRSLDNINDVQEVAQAVEPVRWQSQHGAKLSPRANWENFKKINKLDQKIGVLKQHVAKAPILTWGLYRGGELLKPTQSLQVRTAREYVRRYPYQRLRQALQRTVALTGTTDYSSDSTAKPQSASLTKKGKTRRGGTKQSVYDNLKAYMLLTAETERLDEEANQTFLKKQVLSHVELPGQVPPAEREKVRKLVSTQVNAFISALQSGKSKAFAGNPSLVSNIRDLIYEPPSIERIYKRLKAEGNERTPAFSLSKALKGRGLRFFTTRPEVPGFFTRQAWEGYVQEAMEAQASKPSQVDWVMGYSIEDLPSNMRDADQVAEQLRENYFGEYVKAWKHFLENVRVQRFSDAREAAHALDRLGSGYDSPLLYLLAQATYQTTFRPSRKEKVKDNMKSAAKRKVTRKANRRLGVAGVIDSNDKEDEGKKDPVTSQFKWLHDLKANKAQSGGASPELKRALRSLSDLGKAMQEVSKNRSKATYFAASTLGDEGGEFSASLNSTRNSLSLFNPKVRSNLFSEPVVHAWRGLLADAQQYLNRRWREEVYRPYHRELSRRFPLQLDSHQDAPLNAYERFFRPKGGTLSKFYNDALEPFLSERGEPRTWNGQGLQISTSARNAFEKANRIRDGLFNGNVMRVPFEMQAEQPESSEDAPAVGQVFINIQGQQETYGMGSYRPWKNYEWPGGTDAELRLSTRNGKISVKTKGAWGFFRLIKKASVQSRTATRFQIRWLLEQGLAARYNMRTSRTPNPFGDLKGFFSFRCPLRLAH